MSTLQGSLTIKGLRIYAFHGALAQESRVGNEFEVDLELTFDAETPMRSDSLGHTINYADVIDDIKLQMAQPSKLLEHVAYRIVRSLQKNYPLIISGCVSIYKIHPPVSAQLSRVGFTLRF